MTTPHTASSSNQLNANTLNTLNPESGITNLSDIAANLNDPAKLRHGKPVAQGLYDPANEHDNCGVGFIAHIKGKPSHAIVSDALVMLSRMDHRGACGCEENTGDGAGIMTGLPYEFLTRVAKDDLNLSLPPNGQYAAGLIFLPTDHDQRETCKRELSTIIGEQGLRVLGWRPVPTDNSMIGPTARKQEPRIEMLFVAAGQPLINRFADKPASVLEDAFERQLYVARKFASHRLRGNPQLDQAELFYICSLSTRVIIYKGQLTSTQVPQYYADLRDPTFQSHLAMVHSRFSTNTFPSWDRAQPMRFMSHNGEINTMRGNINWMHAREGLMHSPHFTDEELQKLFPVIEPDTSDSGNFDNALELLYMAGRSMPESMMMMIPEAWQNHESMNLTKEAFYEYHANLMEPWDGPASVVFTDGRTIGATLDRNGLRPSRYYVTDDDMVIMASEVGVVEVPNEKILEKGRLQPGRMFLVDFEQGRLIPDGELKHEITSRRDYAGWLKENKVEINDLEPKPVELRRHGKELTQRLQAFGYTLEHLHVLMRPMVNESKEPLGSMGNDTPLAVLSDKPRLIYDYFKQLFAQVTNPPIDPIREEIIMSLECYIGPEENLLDTTPLHSNRIHLQRPVITNETLAMLKGIDHQQGERHWRSRTIDITFEKPRHGQSAREAMLEALDRICHEATEAIREGDSLIILSDRAVDERRVPISSLLACGTVHHHLVRSAKRTQIGLILETGEAREVHHFATLFGYGADAVNPYLAFEALWQLQDEGVIFFKTDTDADLDKADREDKVVVNYVRAVRKGLLKVMSKVGISTLASYKGAQIFECIGLRDEVIQRCFAGTSSRLQGAGFDVLAKEAVRRHELGYPKRGQVRLDVLPNPGEYSWRSGGEKHMLNPTSIAQLQTAARRGDKDAYWKFANYVNHENEARCTLRGLLDFNKPGQDGRAGQAISIDEVEPASEIVKRFRTGAMSFGSISAEAHESLAIAMNRLGGRSNTGEGGEDPARFVPLTNGDSKRSSIKQIASGRFGVTSWYLTNADVLQIKIAQGAKPGEGGQLPGYKVDEIIARVRYSTPGVGLISPPPHHDIYSIEDLAQLIFDLKNSNPSAQVSVKLVAEVGVGTVAAGVAKAHADHILISGAEGGTGASPLTSIKHAGLPWELGIAEAHQTLVMNNLRSRVRLETDGQLKTGRDVVMAALLGAEEYGFSTAPLITLGCIMMRKCHLNTCPVGIATQNPALRKKFAGQPEHVVNYLFMVAEEARQIMAELGFAKIDEMIGRVDMLHSDNAVKHWKSDGLDLGPILNPAKIVYADTQVRKMIEQDHGIDHVLDRELIAKAKPALEDSKPVYFESKIINTDRTVGAMLSHEVSKRFGESGLPDDTINIKFTGWAGQSFGAWLAHGVSLELEGDANDYVGKGLSGGRLAIYPPKNSRYVAEENILIGNVALYGATSGQAFFRGIAAERFAVRNSGAQTVVEGVGDHGCEYMTGGRVVVLGPTGRNFAAGMSGGIAYVYDPRDELLERCNMGMIDFDDVEEAEDVAELRGLIEAHLHYTGSSLAERILTTWEMSLAHFVKVMPIDYKRVLEARKAEVIEPGTLDVPTQAENVGS